MRGYLLIYCCLFNMAAVWACQTPLFWISPIDVYLQYRLANVIKMMPMSTFFFSLKYFKVVTELVPLQERTRKIFQVILWFSYFSAIILFCFWVLTEPGYLFSSIYFFDSYVFVFVYKAILSFEILISFFTCMFLSTTLILIKRFCS